MDTLNGLRRTLLAAPTLILACMSALSGCGTSDNASSGASGGGTTDLTTFKTGCNWHKIFASGSSHYALSDVDAEYWVAVGPSSPASGAALRIDGNYADARYLSLQVYDGALVLDDALADYQIDPSQGSANPFLAPTRLSDTVQPGGGYTAHVAFAAKPALGAAGNTLYRGDVSTISDASTKRTLLIYRIYVPADGKSPDGGVGLPALTLENGDGTETPLSQTSDGANCSALYQNFEDIYTGKTANPHPGTAPQTNNPPQLNVFYTSALNPGQLVNAHIAYMSAGVTHADGDLFIVRGKAPSFTSQDGAPATPDLRYWSLCQNEYPSQVVDGCVSDHEATVDSGGYFNVVVSSSSKRPSNATSGNGFDWMPWASGDPGLIAYRHMLPQPLFLQAIQNVPKGIGPGLSMGNYYPQLTYCSKSVFEAAAGQTPAQVFAACSSASGS
jgi:hypothetical protein